MSNMVAAEEGIRRYEAFINELGVPSRLSQSELAVSEELLARCADEIWGKSRCEYLV